LASNTRPLHHPAEHTFSAVGNSFLARFRAPKHKDFLPQDPFFPKPFSITFPAQTINPISHPSNK
jgi:hypothetical protein